MASLRSAKRVEQITALYLAGKTPVEIVEAMNAEGHCLTLDAVLKAEKNVMALAKEFTDLEQARAIEVAHLKWMYAQHCAAYEESKKDLVVAIQGVHHNGERYGSVTKTPRVGDPIHLRAAKECRDSIAKLEGLNAPIKIAPTNPAGDKSFELVVKGMTDDELSEYSRMARRIGTLRSQQTTVGGN